MSLPWHPVRRPDVFSPGTSKEWGNQTTRSTRGFFLLPPKQSSHWLVAINRPACSLKSATLLPLSSSLPHCLVMRRSPGTRRALAGLCSLPFPARRSLDPTHSPARSHCSPYSSRTLQPVPARHPRWPKSSAQASPRDAHHRCGCLLASCI